MIDDLCSMTVSELLRKVQGKYIGSFNTQLSCTCGGNVIDYATNQNLGTARYSQDVIFGPEPSDEERLDGFRVHHEYWCDDCGAMYKGKLLKGNVDTFLLRRVILLLPRLIWRMRNFLPPRSSCSCPTAYGRATLCYNFDMQRTKVGILRGGPSNEYDVSLKTGAQVLSQLDQERYIPVDIFIDKEGGWHMRGLPVQPRQVLEGVDVIFNALHGTYGEDGTVQRLLEVYGVPYTGSRSLASAIAMSKLLTKQGLLNAGGVKLPRHIVVTLEDDPDHMGHHLFRTFPQPSVVKPMGSGSSVGVSIVHGPAAIAGAIREALTHSPKVLVEEYISGREATCGVLEHFRGQDLYALPPVEIIPNKGHKFFTYDAKYRGGSQEICPGNFSHDLKKELEDLARLVHQTLGLRHYSRADFIIHPRRGIYFLEVNTLPGLTPESLLPKAVSAVGCSFPQLLDHLLVLALEKK
jgi:D-alanine-D-alanine ligase